MNPNLDQIKSEILAVQTSPELEDLRIKYLGRNGLINGLFSKIGEQPVEKRKDYGQQLNTIKKQIEELLAIQSTKVTTVDTLVQEPESLFSLPKVGHLHPITQTERELNALFKKLGFSVYDSPIIETDEFNFQRLNVPLDHPARDMQDTIYINEPTYLLRTQGSTIESRLLSQQKPPFRCAFPGIVYRNEKVNKSNHFIFHHYQAVVVDKNITMKDLIGTMDLMFKTLYGPSAIVRYRCKYYPEVEPGVGPDMQCFNCNGTGCTLCKHAGWIEMGGSGMIHPNVLESAGINPKIWRGFAFGMGLDRWVMAKFGITDIRTFLGGNLAYKPNIL